MGVTAFVTDSEHNNDAILANVTVKGINSAIVLIQR